MIFSSSMKLGKYKHYKGKLYEVIAIARLESTMEKMAVYKALYDTSDLGKNPMFVRPLESFEEDVEVNGKIVPRFEFVK